jgi:hypothetical protein
MYCIYAPALIIVCVLFLCPKQIYDLEAEMERVRLSAHQTQRNLSAKIGQLQSALNICLGGSTCPPAPFPPPAHQAPGHGVNNFQNVGMTGFGF